MVYHHFPQSKAAILRYCRDKASVGQYPQGPWFLLIFRHVSSPNHGNDGKACKLCALICQNDIKLPYRIAGYKWCTSKIYPNLMANLAAPTTSVLVHPLESSPFCLGARFRRFRSTSSVASTRARFWSRRWHASGWRWGFPARPGCKDASDRGAANLEKRTAGHQEGGKAGKADYFTLW